MGVFFKRITSFMINSEKVIFFISFFLAEEKKATLILCVIEKEWVFS